MTTWEWLLAACAAAYATKLAGYLVPPRWLRHERAIRVAGTLTVGLLASLTALSAFATGTRLAVDARAGALVAAGVALWLRAPFLVVVVVGAAVAAAIRSL